MQMSVHQLCNWTQNSHIPKSITCLQEILPSQSNIPQHLRPVQFGVKVKMCLHVGKEKCLHMNLLHLNKR